MRHGIQLWWRSLTGALVCASTLVPAPADAGIPTPQASTQHEQGTEIHDTGRFESVNLVFAEARDAGQKSLGGLRVEKGELRSDALAGEKLVGVTFPATLKKESYALRIDAVQPHRANADAPVSSVWEYKVSVTHGAKPARPLCAGKSGYALVAPGKWDAEGNLDLDKVHFTFACVQSDEAGSSSLVRHRGGVMAKCIDWGYAPWVGAAKTDAAPAASTEEHARALHEACTRMARGDYCGTGTHNTVRGTPILVFTPATLPLTKSERTPVSGPLGRDGQAAKPSEGAGFHLEAAWAPDAAGRPGAAVCLSKHRWSTLPTEGQCAAVGTHPRAAAGGHGCSLKATARTPGTSPLHCEDYTLAELTAKGAMLFNYSMSVDAGLYQCVKADHSDKPGEAITTTQVDHSQQPSRLNVAIRARLGIKDPCAYTCSFEGPVLDAQVPGPVKDHFKSGLAPLNLYKDDKGHFLTITDAPEAPAGYTLVELEGYVLRPRPKDRPLHLWKKDNVVVSAVESPGKDYKEERLVGYLPSLKEEVDAAEEE